MVSRISSRPAGGQPHPEGARGAREVLASRSPSAPVDSAELTQGLLASIAEEARSLEGKLSPHVPGEVLVRLKGGIFKSAQEDFLRTFGAGVVEKFDIPRDIFKDFDGDLLRLRLPEGLSTAQAMAAMSKDDRVQYVVPNDIYELEGQVGPVIPNDLHPNLYGLHNTGQNGGTADADIDAPEAWAITTGSRENGPLIAILDTGADYNHPDLANNIWTNPNETADGQDNDGNGVVDDLRGYNAFADNGNPRDGHSHGTHVAGTIGAEGDNERGVVGVNWSARMLPVKIFDDSGRTTADAILRGILYATRMGARITSNSWGGGAFNQAIHDAFGQSPALHIMAAGNSGADNDRRPHYPSSYDLPNIVAVAASDRNDNLAYFSNYGATSVDLAAPGVDIYSTVPGGGYSSKSGTSMATPHVTGVAALIAQAFPNATSQEIKDRLLAGADRLPQLDGRVLTGARLNAANALEDDRLPPAAPNDFAAVEASSTSVRLSWTATGDDGWCGHASGYELRFSDRPIATGEAGQGEIPFDQAQKAAVGRPGETGTLEQATVRLVPSGQERQLYFALRVRDNVGNASEVRTTRVTVPATQLAFEDDIDAGGQNWTPQGSWSRVEEGGRGFVWTDSPAGRYENRAEASLTSRPITLAGYKGSTLMFDARYDIEQGYDKLEVEASEDGQNWHGLKSFTGKSGWETHTLDLSRFDGRQVQVRFRLQTDSSVNADGFYLDRVVIAGDRVQSPTKG